MNIINKTLAVCFASLLSSVVSAEVVNWQFEGVITQDIPGVNIGDSVTGSVSFDTNATYICCDEFFTHYDDFNSQSKFEITVNGVVYESVVSPINPANLFINQFANVDYNFNYHTMVASNGEPVDFATFNIFTNTPSPFTNPAELPTEVPADIVNATVDVCGPFGCFVANLTSVEALAQSPIAVDITNGGATIPQTGGRLYFGRYVTNTSTVEIKFKRWANLTWPNGIVYNRDTPKNITLAPGASSNQPGAYYTIPSHWPAGQYEYRIHTLTPEGELSTDAFMFNKN